MRIVFLGGTRFIGPRAVGVAHARGHSVAVLHRGIHRTELPRGVEEVLVDREDVGSLRAALAKTRPDVVIDMFAMTADQARRATDSLRAVTGKVVVLSSQDVYAQFGRLNGLPAGVIEESVTESSPLTIPYPFRGIVEHEGGANYDKKDVEAIYQRGSEGQFESVTVLRLPGVFGWGDYQRRFAALIERLWSKPTALPCQNRASWRWTVSHVQNAAYAIVLAAEKSLAGYHVFNVGEEHTPTMRERVEKFARLLDVSFGWKEADVLPDDLSILGRMPNDFVVDSQAIRAKLGFEEILEEDECYRDLINWTRHSRSLG